MEIALARNNVKLAKKEALEYLATEGYIVQRRNSDIEEILADASQLREIDNNNKLYNEQCIHILGILRQEDSY